MKSLFDMTLEELRAHLKLTREKMDAAQDSAEYNTQAWREKLCLKLISKKEGAYADR